MEYTKKNIGDIVILEVAIAWKPDQKVKLFKIFSPKLVCEYIFGYITNITVHWSN